MIHEMTPQCRPGWLIELLGETCSEGANISPDCDVAYSFNEVSVHTELLIDDLKPDFRKHVNDEAAGQNEFGYEHRYVDSEPEFTSIGRYSETFRGHHESLKGLAASLGLHIALLCLLLFHYFDAPTGIGILGYGTVMVRLVSHEEYTPDAPSPAGIDSPPLVASMGGSLEQAATEKARRAVSDLQHVVDATARVSYESNHEPRLTPNSNTEAWGDQAGKEAHTERGPNPYESAPSTSSIAAVERRLAASAGTASPGFREEVLSAIMQAAYYPRTALGSKRHGEVLVAFAVNRDGSMKDLRIAQHSGIEILDQAALNIVRKASKRFPKLPERFNTESVNYVVPIVFKEARSRVKE
ncbi:MAG: energy transducer TonB [Thermodesulfobacteriota bacterium]